MDSVYDLDEVMNGYESSLMYARGMNGYEWL